MFTTQSGSVYELDPDQPRVRRVRGENDPTPRQGEDGEWREYEFLSEVAVGASVAIVWRFEDGLAKSTLTSTVTSVS